MEQMDRESAFRQGTADFDPVTKLLHVFLAITLCFQMVVGLFVHDPNTLLFLYLHQYGGLVAGLVLLIEWMWIFAKDQWGLFFPLNKEGMQQVFVDLKRLVSFRLPPGGATVGLAGLWHGFGLLVFSVLGVTGILILFALPNGHSILGVSSHDFSGFTRLSLIHAIASYAAWAYLAGHVTTAVLHQVTGEKIVSRMFFLKRVTAAVSRGNGTGA
ncbi:MAG: cytochrome b/b6 domain-containing protein [Gammaproteobacteria bacterium]|jgi:cytochrome b561